MPVFPENSPKNARILRISPQTGFSSHLPESAWNHHAASGGNLRRVALRATPVRAGVPHSLDRIIRDVWDVVEFALRPGVPAEPETPEPAA